MLRFMETPCLMKNVEACATHIPNGRVASQMGIMLRTSFISSTFVTVARVQGFCFSAEFSVLMMAALSRNLIHITLEKVNNQTTLVIYIYKKKKFSHRII